MRLIDVVRFCADNPNFNSEVYVALSKAPTIDAVPVVRCKDCEEYIPWLDRKICARIGSYFGNTKPNDFCSYGKRRCDNDTP